MEPKQIKKVSQSSIIMTEVGLGQAKNMQATQCVRISAETVVTQTHLIRMGAKIFLQTLVHHLQLTSIKFPKVSVEFGPSL